jgi:hypothetical protein
MLQSAGGVYRAATWRTALPPERTMFPSTDRLSDDIRSCLDLFLTLGQGSYACVLDAQGIRFETPQASIGGAAGLREIIRERRAAILAIGGRLASDEPMEDVFAGWEEDDLFVAVINSRVALIVVGPEPERLRDQGRKPLKALADRLLRLEPSYGIDTRGRGFFVGRPKLDLIVISRRDP